MPKPKPSMLVRALVGPAGEHYVLFRLYRLGLMAALAPPGAPDVDVLVLTPDQEVAAQVQVKTRTYGTDKGWHMKPKHERLVDDRLIYAFVDLEPRVGAGDLRHPQRRRSRRAGVEPSGVARRPGREGPSAQRQQHAASPAGVQARDARLPAWLARPVRRAVGHPAQLRDRLEHS